MIIWLKELLMQILIWILGFIDTVFEVFRAVAGLDTVTTPSGEQSISEYFMQLDGVQWAFWVVFIAAIGICAVCTVVAIVKNIINAKGGEPKSHVRTIGQSLSTTVVALFMAMLLVVGMGCADRLLGAIDNSINHGEKSIMSHEIIGISVADGYIRDTDNVLGLNKYDQDTGEATFVSYLYDYATEDGKIKKIATSTGIVTVEYGDEYIVYLDKNGQEIGFYSAYTLVHESNGDPKFDDDGNEVYELNREALVPINAVGGWNKKPSADGTEYYTKDSLPSNMWNASVEGILGDDTWVIVPLPYDWKYDGMIASPDDFNFIIAYICAIVLLIALIGATFGLVKRLFDIVLLFITLPGIAATIPLDDGAKFKLWRETVISKVFLAFGTVLAVNVFTIIAPSIWGISLGTEAGGFTNSVLRLVLICGGALTISGGQLLFARLLGTSAEESREMGQSARTLLGGATAALGGVKAAGRLAFGTRNANGQRVGGLIKGGASVAGTVGGGAVNAVGGMIGGQAYRSSKLGRGVSATQQALRGFGGSSGWFGHGKISEGGTIGGSVGSGIGKLGGKFANSKAGQSSGLNNGIVGGIRTAAGTPGRHRREQTAQQMQGFGAAFKAADAEFTAKAQTPVPTEREVLPGFENAPATPTAAQAAAQKAADKKE